MKRSQPHVRASNAAQRRGLAALALSVGLVGWASIGAPGLIGDDLAPARDRSSEQLFHNCAEARAMVGTPIRSGEPGYRDGLDRDHDGLACEPYGAGE